MVASGTSPPQLGLTDAQLTRLGRAGLLDERGAPLPELVPMLHAIRTGPDPDGARERAVNILERTGLLPAEAMDRLAALSGSSRVLSQTLLTHPEWLVSSVPSQPAASDPAAIHQFVRRRLVDIAAADLLGRLDMPEVGRALSGVADAAASAALVQLAVPLAVVAMGKWGGEELNYSSDIDVLFVSDGDVSTAQMGARRFIEVLSTPTTEGSAFRVDADLRPEGQSGPLTRSLDSYRAYYERWAEPWEFQALLKARPAAGDLDLGRRFCTMVETFVWPESLSPETVRTVRDLKARSEARAQRSEVKRGAGGIRDIEFAVQLLQLVHGRADPELRTRSTLDALAQLALHGYVREGDAHALSASYRWLRTLEHRLQLWELRRTHDLPAGNEERDRIAKSMGYRDRPEGAALESFEADMISHRTTVRGIHQRLFYRPLLEAFAASPSVRLTADGAARQLAALGFRDQAGAKRAVAELTAGLSRRSRLMHQFLPLMLDWLSDTPNPDLGLEQLRLLVGSAGEVLVGTLRDNPLAAERLCRLLGASRMLGTYLDRIPEFLPRLADEQRLLELPNQDDTSSAIERVAVRRDPDDRVDALRRFARRRILRIAAADLLGMVDDDAVATALTQTAQATLEAALTSARLRDRAALPDVTLSVVAMGRFGGRELGYGSDLDVLYLHESSEADREAALRLAAATSSAIGEPGLQPIAFRVDADLRPEGKDGPLSRSLDGYRTYYERWAQTWEFQALLKARPAAGDSNLGQRFMEMIEPLVWRPLPIEAVREIKHMKARIEQERMPAGEDPDFHLKLGPGGLVDVEFTVQMLQLRHGHAEHHLRVPGTIGAISALVDAGLLVAPEGRALEEAHRFCTRVRNRLFLQTGKPLQAFPSDPEETTRLAASLGYERRVELREDYRRLTRRARQVVQRRFYGVE